MVASISLLPTQLTFIRHGEFFIINASFDPKPTCDSIDGVESSKDCGASCAVDEEGEAALRLVLQHPLLKLLRDHSAPVAGVCSIEKCLFDVGGDGFVYTERVVAEIGF